MKEVEISVSGGPGSEKPAIAEEGRQAEKDETVLYALSIIVTAFLATGACAGYQLGNDFMFYLFALVAFAPATAIVAVKTYT